MDPEKWKSFTERIHIYAPMDSLYTAMATAEGLMGWCAMEVDFTDAEGNPLPSGQQATPGDRYQFRWPKDIKEEGEFLEANGTDRVRFAFGEGIECTMDLEDAGDGSIIVTLVQTQDKGDEMNLKIMLGYMEGWAFYVTNLKSVLEGGSDLRDYAHDTEGLINI